MKQILDFLQGKRTYLIAAIAILTAVLGYLNGDISLLDAGYAIMGALGLTAVRAGSKNDAKAVIESRPTNDTSVVDEKPT